MKTDFITIKFPYQISKDQTKFFDLLTDMRRQQSAMYRSAYTSASFGVAEISIRSDLTERYKNQLDSWFLQSAIKRGIGQFKADAEGAKTANKSIVTRIFGGKNNLKRRAKGLISNQEFKEKRIERLRSIGEAPQKGNRKFELNANSITFKPIRGTKFELELPKLHGNYKKHYDGLVIATHNKAISVTIELDHEFIYLSFDANLLHQEKIKKVIKGRYLGIDLNPNYIGVSYFDENKKLLDTKLFNFKALTGKNINADKLKHELREVAIQIGKQAEHYQTEFLFVEDLNFKQGNKGIGKNYNRLVTNQFLYNEFKRMLAKFGKVVEVNAAYSSTIGNIVHSQYPDPIAASMEIARRGIESRVVKASKLFYPPLVNREVLVNRWKEELIPDLFTWIELHNWLKKSGLKYRVDIPGISMFRKFSSNKSGILIY